MARLKVLVDGVPLFDAEVEGDANINLFSEEEKPEQGMVTEGHIHWVNANEPATPLEKAVDAYKQCTLAGLSEEGALQLMHVVQVYGAPSALHMVEALAQVRDAQGAGLSEEGAIKLLNHVAWHTQAYLRKDDPSA